MSATPAATSNSLERTITLSIDIEQLQAPIAARIRELGRKAKMPGFRPGKVPQKVLEQTYGLQAQTDAINDAINTAFTLALVEQKLRPAGSPEIAPVEGKADFTASSGSLQFTAKFEVYPEISLPDPAALSVQRWVCPIADADIDRTLESLRAQRVSYETAARPAQKDDQVRLDFVGTLDGVAFDGGTAHDFRFVVGNGQMLPEFDAAVVAMSAGETKTFPLNFPSDYGAENLAGKQAEFKVTLHEVLGPVLPELNDELAVSFGVKEDGLAKLRADVSDNLKRETSARCKAKTKQSVMDALVAASSFDVPTALIEQESKRLADQMRQEMAGRGMNVKDMPLPPELFKDNATKRVRLGLLVGDIVRGQKLQATEDQVKALLLEMAQSYEKPEEFVRWAMSQRERRMDAEAVVVEDNVVAWVLAAAKVENVDIAVTELMKDQ